MLKKCDLDLLYYYFMLLINLHEKTLTRNIM